MDDFSIAPPSAVPPQPLPLTPSAPAAPPAQGPQAPQPGGMNLRGSLPLLAILPIIAKRFGPQGLAAALQGYEQGQQIKAQRGQQLFENQRQVANDQRSAQMQQQQEADRQAQVRNQTLQQRTGFLDTARKTVEGMDDPDQLAAYQRYIAQAGQPYGITEQDLAPITTVPATTLQKRQATKKLGELEKAYTDTQRAQLEQSGTKFQIGGETLTLPEIRQRAGVAAFNAAGQSAAVPVKPPTTNAGSFEDYVQRFATDQGKTDR
jgi:membrane-bound lytic murein transglycosylase